MKCWVNWTQQVVSPVLTQFCVKTTQHFSVCTILQLTSPPANTEMLPELTCWFHLLLNLNWLKGRLAGNSSRKELEQNQGTEESFKKLQRLYKCLFGWTVQLFWFRLLTSTHTYLVLFLLWVTPHLQLIPQPSTCFLLAASTRKSTSIHTALHTVLSFMPPLLPSVSPDLPADPSLPPLTCVFNCVQALIKGIQLHGPSESCCSLVPPHSCFNVFLVLCRFEF